MPAKIKRAVVLLVAACAIALAGCSSHETQQQKFTDALSHGNSAQASQIWLHMDASSRADFAETVYWNAGLQTGPDGEAMAQFGQGLKAIHAVARTIT